MPCPSSGSSANAILRAKTLVSPASLSHRMANGSVPVSSNIPPLHPPLLQPLATDGFRDFYPADRIAVPLLRSVPLRTECSAFVHGVAFVSRGFAVSEQAMDGFHVDVAGTKCPPATTLPGFLVLPVALVAHSESTSLPAGGRPSQFPDLSIEPRPTDGIVRTDAMPE